MVWIYYMMEEKKKYYCKSPSLTITLAHVDSAVHVYCIQHTMIALYYEMGDGSNNNNVRIMNSHSEMVSFHMHIAWLCRL